MAAATTRLWSFPEMATFMYLCIPDPQPQQPEGAQWDLIQWNTCHR